MGKWRPGQFTKHGEQAMNYILIIFISFIISNSSIFSGTCAEGNCSNGHGIMNFPNGDRYIGEFRAEKKSGYGVYIFANGDKYEGDFSDDYPHGNGTAILVNGNKYTGEFKFNFPDGKGTMNYANGNVYVGEWKKGLKDGYGTMTYMNGNKYVGEWRNGKKHGQGTFLHGDSLYSHQRPTKPRPTQKTQEGLPTPFWTGVLKN